MLPLPKYNLNREELFIQRYSKLLEQAMRLTKHNAAEAEDLLHDTFIHFTLSQTPVENISNLDGYLYTMLRNLHLAHERQRTRTSQEYLSLIDYDSVEAGLSSIDPCDTIKIQDELRSICRYVCLRKETSKAGSVLLLRFIFGYLPNEISQILRSPRSAVDNFLQTARREVRAFSRNPETVTFLHTDEKTELPLFSFGHLSPDILSEVRQTIFITPDPDCPKESIITLYQPDTGSSGGVNARILAHLVACPVCLEEVNEKLGLPSLASRLSAIEEKPKDKKPGAGGGSGGGMGIDSTDAFLKRSRQRLKKVFEHRPEELLISVNGFIVGSQRVTSELSELALAVNIDERIGFIEIFSERDVRLLFQSVEPPPDGLAVQPALVELSDGRRLEISLDFRDSRPHLYAKYLDPTFHEVWSMSETGMADGLNGRHTKPQNADAAQASEMKAGIFSTLAAKLRNLFHLKVWLQPARLTAIFGVLLFAGLIIWKMSEPVPSITVADLMQKAAFAEQQSLPANVVIHRDYTLEERDGQGILLASRKIDAYRSGEQKLTVKRQYDETGRLIGGEWKRSDGSRTLYSTKEKPKIEQRPERINLPPMSLEEAWLLDLSAVDFQNLTSRDGTRIAEETAAFYTVAYKASASADTEVPKITNAWIKFSKEDFRAIEQILEVQRGDQTREYRYVEASYQKLPTENVRPSVFEPERELLAALLKNLNIKTDDAKEPSTQPETVVSAEQSNTNIANPPVITPATATADLEIEALNLLNQAGADTGEQVSVSRTKGVIRIDGLVETENRKRELINALAPIAKHPAVRISIMTVAEALQKEQSRKQSESQKGQVTAERIETGNEEVPTKNQLRTYFGSDEAANNFAARMIGRSRNAMGRAAAMKRLTGQFTLAELKNLSPDAREKWLTLIRSHARAFQQEIAALRQDLTPVFGGGGSGVGARAIDDDTELIRAVNRLFELGSANDRTVRAALSISSDRGAGNLGTSFFSSLRTTEEIAAAIERAK